MSMLGKNPEIEPTEDMSMLVDQPEIEPPEDTHCA